MSGIRAFLLESSALPARVRRADLDRARMGEIHCPPMNGAAVLRHYYPQQVFAYTIMPTSAWCRPSVKGVVGRDVCRLGVGITISL
jgi:hypothetical protein